MKPEQNHNKTRNFLFFQKNNSLLMKLMHFVTIDLCVCSNSCVPSQFELVCLIHSIYQYRFWIYSIINSICFGKIMTIFLADSLFQFKILFNQKMPLIHLIENAFFSKWCTEHGYAD